MKRTLLFLGLLLLAFGVVFSLAVATRWGEVPVVTENASPAEIDPAPRADAAVVVALGRLEPSEGIIHVGATVGDRLETLEVSQGDVVTEGQQLGYLSSRWLRETEVEINQLQLDEATRNLEAESEAAASRTRLARLAEQEAKATPVEIEAQEKRLETLQVQLELTQKDLERMHELSPEVVSPPEIERQQLRVQQAELELRAAMAELERLQQTIEFRIRTAEAEREAAEAAERHIEASAALDSLNKSLELTRQQLQRSFIVAPADGQVLRILTQPGEFIAQGPVLQMANLEKMVCIAEVFKTELRHLQLEQPVRIHSRAFEEPFHTEGLRGRVTEIGRVVAEPQLRPLDPFAPVDRHVAEVRIELEPQSAQQATRFLNMQVEVRFLPQDEPQNQEE